MKDLVGDLYRALREVQGAAQVRRWMAERGLTRERCRLVGGVGVARATLTRSTMTWEPHPDGEKVLICPVWDGPAYVADGPYRHPSPLLDLVAWRHYDICRLYLRAGAGSVLGADGIRQAMETASPIRLFRAAEDFIRYGGEVSGEHSAAVLLNPSFALFHLGNLPAIIADDVEHGLALQDILLEQRPAIPPIRIPATNEVAA